MRTSTAIFIVCLILLTLILGFNYFAQPFAGLFQLPETTPTQVSTTPGPEIAPDPTFRLLSQLTPRQKILQLLAVPVVIDQKSTQLPNPETMNWVLQHYPGFVTLFGENISTSSALMVRESLQKSPTVWQQPVIAVDHEGGSVQRLRGKGFTLLPDWKTVCAPTFSQRQTLFQQSATELKAVGVKIVFAPVIDIAVNNRVLKNRICANDVTTIKDRAHEVMVIYEQQGIMPVIKHFPGIGQTTKDLHLAFDKVRVTTDEVVLFRSLLDQHPRSGVMVTHVGVENQFSEVPCSISSACVGELKENYPQVLIFSDALEMKAAAHQLSSKEEKSLETVALEALLAGNNVLVFGPGVSTTDLEAVITRIEQEYQGNPQLVEHIDQSLEKIIGFKQNGGAL